MAIYVVMEPARDRAYSEPQFVRDGFAWLGFFVPLFWLLWFRLWIETAVVVAVMLGLGALAEISGFGLAASVISLLLSLFVALEGPALRIAALSRRGWREWGVVDAHDRADAETRYIAETGTAGASGSEARPLAKQAPRGPMAQSPELTFFGYSGSS